VTEYRLREIDIELMRRLSPRVNVIPVIGKADSLTPLELASSKKLIMEDIDHYQIPIYNFPYDVEEDDEDTVQENDELRGLMPFAIVGSEDTLEVKGKKIRARIYPWGVVEVDNPRHSDFLAIRSALLHSHLADLKEITHDFLYENYRTEKLSKSVVNGTTYIPIIKFSYLFFKGKSRSRRFSQSICTSQGRTAPTRRRPSQGNRG
jgi:cell division control protein 11